MKGLFLRDGFLFGRGFLPALVLAALTGLLCFLAGYSVSKSASSETAPVSVALVNEDDSMTGLIAVNAVKEAPFIKGLLEFVDSDLETAKEALQNGRFEAVIHLPKGYIQNISHGIPGKGYIYLSGSAAASGEIIRSIASFGELMLVAGQQGVFVGEDLVLAHGLSEAIHEDYLTKSNSALLEHAFSLFDGGSVVEVTDYAGSGLPLLQSYAVLWLAFFLLITGLFFGPLYTTDLKKGLLIRLYSGGVRPFGFLSGKLFYPFVFRLLVTVPVLVFLCFIFPPAIRPGSLLFALLGLVIATVFITSASVILSERKGAPALIAGIAVVSLLLSGGIVPRAFLPEIVTKIARFLPVGALYHCLSPLFGGTVDVPAIIAGALEAGLLLFLSLLFLKQFPERGETA